MMWIALDLSCLGFTQLLETISLWVLSSLGSYQLLFLRALFQPYSFFSLSGTLITGKIYLSLWSYSSPKLFSVFFLCSDCTVSIDLSSSSVLLSFPLFYCCTRPLSLLFQLLYFPILKFPLGSLYFSFFAEVLCFTHVCNCSLKHFYHGT